MNKQELLNKLTKGELVIREFLVDINKTKEFLLDIFHDESDINYIKNKLINVTECYLYFNTGTFRFHSDNKKSITMNEAYDIYFGYNINNFDNIQNLIL